MRKFNSLEHCNRNYIRLLYLLREKIEKVTDDMIEIKQSPVYNNSGAAVYSIVDKQKKNAIIN